MLVTDNTEWTNMCSIITVSLGQGSFILDDTENNKVEHNYERVFGSAVAFWRLANRVI
jgi:hypothetical protein